MIVTVEACLLSAANMAIVTGSDVALWFVLFKETAGSNCSKQLRIASPSSAL